MGPIVLGMILGPLLDMSYRRSMMSVRNQPFEFMLELVRNPISLALTIMVLAMIIGQTPLPRKVSAYWNNR